MDSMEKKQKIELMQFMKIKPSTNLDLKSKILKEYNLPDKGEQFKNIDQKKMELEATMKHLPLSIERMTMQCKNDIALCENFEELKTQLRKKEKKPGDQSPNSPIYHKKPPPPIKKCFHRAHNLSGST
jgi:hypothetical protein